VRPACPATKPFQFNFALVFFSPIHENQRIFSSIDNDGLVETSLDRPLHCRFTVCPEFVALSNQWIAMWGLGDPSRAVRGVADPGLVVESDDTVMISDIPADMGTDDAGEVLHAPDDDDDIPRVHPWNAAPSVRYAVPEAGPERVKLSGGGIVGDVMRTAKDQLGEPMTSAIITALGRIAESALALARRLNDEEHVQTR
jgi:hypothetical protein